MVQFCDAVFGISSQYPIGNGVLWFLRSLIAFQFFALLFMGLFSRDRKLATYCSIILVLIVGCMIGVDRFGRWIVTFVGTPSSPVYFAIGFVLSRKILSKQLNKGMAIITGFSAAIVFFIIILCRVSDFALARHVMNVLIVIILWSILQFADKLRWGNGIFETTFFVYCMHRVPVEYVNLLFENSLPCIREYPDLYYFFLSFLCLSVLFTIATLCRTYTPLIYSILAGKRR